MIGLLVVALVIVLFVFIPIARVVLRGFVGEGNRFSVEYFGRYVDPYYARVAWRTLWNTFRLGIGTATGGTAVGFLFAYAMTRCRPPAGRVLHVLALVPTVSPPFAIAMSTILLFGRNGLITRRFLGMQFPPGANDIYGLDGLAFVQILTFFPVAYLIIRAMLERLHPSLEEAAHSLGASKFQIFRTITLPLLTPGLAASFLLLFVESLADLGNPLLLSGNADLLATKIFLAISGEFDYQKASTLALILLLPTLIIYVAQRYIVNRRSFIAITGKPASGHTYVKEPLTRWIVNLTVLAVALLIVVLYLSILVGSISTVWGIDFTLTLAHWKLMLTRGVEAILDTVFLSVMATPIAGLLGMVIAFLVVRTSFSGKDTLDFGSNLGAGVPGTILGIGFVLIFRTDSWVVSALIYLSMALLLLRRTAMSRRERWVGLAIGTALAVALRLVQSQIGVRAFIYLLGGGYLAMALAMVPKHRTAGLMTAGLAVYLFCSQLIRGLSRGIGRLGIGSGSDFLRDGLVQLGDYINVPFQIPTALLAIGYLCVGFFIIRRLPATWHRSTTPLFLMLGGALCFTGKPLAIIGTAYIIIAAFVVRSLPASVRSGIASLRQIDPAIEEASKSLGADTSYTFRHVTLPLISPALIAGLIFSFTRSMTSLSAIIFLVSPRWRIVTASILSEWEQGGISFAAAYATVIILLVLVAIAGIYHITRRLVWGETADLTIGM